MKKEDKWTFKNEVAIKDRLDPRDELKNFVNSFSPFITDENKKRIFETYRLSGRSDDEKLEEFVETNYPSKVLEMCFNAGHLHDIAAKEYDIPKDEGHSDNEIIEQLLSKFGYKKEVKPDGLTQIREEFQPQLEVIIGSPHLETSTIDSFLGKMAREIEKLMNTLFLFHSGVLRERLEELDDDENYIKLDTLCSKYKKEKKQLGNYVIFLNKLMKLFQPNEAPLKPHLLAEINFFVIYRNLLLKNPDEKFWEQHKSNADKSIKIFNNTEDKWTEIWNRIVFAWEGGQQFPEFDMFRRMVVFFDEFLKTLVREKIYPRVIVMQYHKFDKYGSHTIHAIDDAGRDADFVYVFFNPFEQYYYQARTNPISISPTLVLKNDLKNWAIPT